MAARPPSRGEPHSEASVVEDEEGFASSVEDEHQQADIEDKVFEVQTTTSNEEGGDDDRHASARLQIEH